MERARALYRFGDFELDPHARRLRHRGAPTRIADKPFDLLLLLVRAGTRGVTRAEAIAALWPEIKVHENSLAVAVSTLRRTLAAASPSVEWIETIPRRGYRLLAPTTIALAGPGAPNPGADGGLAARPQSGGFGPREAQVDALHALLRRTHDGSGGLVWICGEAGVGKTMLIERFLEETAALPVPTRTARGRCVRSFGAAEALLPVIEAIGQLLAGSDGARARALLARHCPAFCLYYPGHFADDARLEAARREMQPADSATTMRMLCDALAAIAEETPLVLALEDLHWADPATADLLQFVSYRFRSARVLMIGTYRTGFGDTEPPLLQPALHGSADRELDPRFELRCLSPREVEQYLEHALGPCDLSRALAFPLWQRTEGLPLFVACLLRTAIQENTLEHTAAGWRANGALEDLFARAPANVSALIRSTLDTLPTSFRTVLDVAAVAGYEFCASTVALALACDERVVEHELLALARSTDLVVVVGDTETPGGMPTVGFRFRHVLVQAELYDALARWQRIALHGRVADALCAEAAPGGGPPSQRFLDNHSQAELAFHLEGAGRFGEALVALLRAGDHCDRRFAKGEALSYYERARALLPRLPAVEQRVWGLIVEQSTGWAKLDLDDLEGARRAFESAGAHAGALEASETDPATQRALTAGFRHLEGFWEDPVLRRPTPVLPRQTMALGVPALHAEAQYGRSLVLHFADRPSDVLAASAELLALAERTGNHAWHAEALALSSVALLELGRLDQARGVIERCLSIARPLAHARAIDIAGVALAAIHVFAAELDPAEAMFREVEAQTHVSKVSARCLEGLGDVAARRGEVRKAFALHTEARRQRERSGDMPPFDGWILRELGAFERAAERDLAAAERTRSRHARRSVELACSAACSLVRLGRSSHARSVLAGVVIPPGLEQSLVRMQPLWAARCELYAATSDLSALVSEAMRWRAAAEAVPARESRMHALYWLARAALDANERSAAREHLAQALELYETHPIPLFGVRLHRLAEHAALRSNDRRAAQRARSTGDALVAKIAATIDDPDLQRTFLREAAAPTAPRALAHASRS
nr:MAG: hypothetical protein DIU78_00375 [Pseudomonadota bacterium]